MLALSPSAVPAYHRHRPEQTALYTIVAKHYLRFVQEIERSGGHLPQFVRQDFEDYLKCGLLEHGFLRVKFKCDGCRHEHLVASSANTPFVMARPTCRWNRSTLGHGWPPWYLGHA